MSSRRQQLAKLGLLLRVRLALAETICPSFVIESFKITGIYPLSIESMIKSRTTKVSTDEMSEIHEKLPKLSKKISVQGELFEKDFKIFGKFAQGLKNKDNLVLNHRRSVILTSRAVVARELAKIEAKNNEALKKTLLAEHMKKFKEIKKNTPIVLKFTKVGVFLK